MSSKLILPPHNLRQMLRAVLPTDSDFTAFCSDFFPKAADLFSNGMDRVAKATLLLEVVNAQTIVAALKEYAPERLLEYELVRKAHAASQKNPYRGLSAFQLDEAHLFFGREALTGQLWQRFEALCEKSDATRLLAVLGPSGSGKSSVARAGLLAALVRSPVPGPQPIRLAIVKPGERPIESLARALVPLLPPDSSVLPASRQVAIEKLLRDKEVAAQGLRRFAADLPDISTSPLVVFVDQFEELYTLCKDSIEHDIFVETLLHAASDSGRHVSIVVTLRSDFLGETQRQHPALNRIIAAQHELIPAMSPEELRDAIAKPAEQAGRPIDDTTVELLLTEARGSQGALPLLEFALTRIWEGMERGEEPGATLRKLGGVGGALVGEAQKIYKALTVPEQATARRALVRLVRLGEGTHDTRRRAPLSELCGQMETEALALSVLRKFATENARLVTLDGKGAEALAEVTHEALFEHWTDLRSWIEQGRKDRGLHDRALEAAKLWNQDGRPAGRLWRPPDLDLLRDYQRRKPEEFGALLAAFLAAAKRRQQSERALSVGAVAAVVAALLIAAFVYVAKERQRTREASAAKEHIRQQLLHSYVERGAQLIFESGKSSEGLLWLHRAQGQGSQDKALPDLLKSAMQSADSTKAVLIGHGASVHSAVFSPDGRHIVTASGDSSARVWEAASGRMVSELKGHAASVSSAVFSPAGRHIVTASGDNSARVWEAASGRLVSELKGHTAKVYRAVFSPDGRRIVTASGDNSARVWETASGRLVFELKGHAARIYRATYSPDGHRIVTASFDKTARVWEAEGGRLLSELKGHGASVNSATYSPDSRRIVTVSDDQTARVWEAESGRLVVELKGHVGLVYSATFSPDGRLIVTASGDNSARVWEAESGRLVVELKGHAASVYNAMFSSDGRLIVTASADNSARVWEAKSGRLVIELKGHGASVNTAMFSSDGRHVVTASDDQTGRVWKAEGSRLIAELEGHRGSVYTATFSPDGRRIVTASFDKTARVWEAADGRLVVELKGHGDSVYSATFSPDGRRIVTASFDQTARVWEAESGRLITELKGHTASVYSATFSPDGRRIVTVSRDRMAAIWDTGDGRLVVQLKGHAASVLSATFSPDGRRIVTASDDNTARVWDTEGGRFIVELKGHAASVYSATFSPDGRRIVTASFDNTARIWDAESGHFIFELKGHAASVYAATFSPDGRQIVTASDDNTARVWEADSARLVAELKGHAASIYRATFSPDGYHIVTASDDQTARVWEAEGGRLVAELKGHGDSVKSATFSPDGRRIVTASMDNMARVWDLSPETRTYEQLAKRIRCHVPAQFEREGSTLIVFQTPNPAECQTVPHP